MRKLISFLLVALLLTGCTAPAEVPQKVPELNFTGTLHSYTESGRTYTPRYDTPTVITLSDEGITVNGHGETDAVFTSHDIIYYENIDAYESGNPYGEGSASEKHTADEAAAHTVVNITAPGAYHVKGRLSAGQIRIDLGEEAYSTPEAVVELILEDVDITCTVAPAILFLNTYECDSNWSTETATPDVDTAAAGANLILQGNNTVNGSHVAKIFKDKEDEKKLWKQDGAIYSYMSMNVYGPGSLDLTADNEGLDTELHLSIFGGDITIRADNDGINTNEDGVSVTAIHGGSLHILAGLGAEGDGIDSNGYLVINGGTVVAAAHPAADAGLDSDLGSFIHGGTVLALGSAMDWAESDSRQVTMNLQFSEYQSADSAILVCRPDGNVVFAYDPDADEILADHSRQYMGAILSRPDFQQGDSYHVYTGGSILGEEINGFYTRITGYSGGTQMAYIGTDVMMRPGMGGTPGPRPEGEGFEGFEPPEKPEGDFPEEPPADGGRGEPPEGFDGQRPEDMPPPEGGIHPMNGNFGDNTSGEASFLFYMQDMVNFFSGLKKS